MSHAIHRADGSIFEDLGVGAFGPGGGGVEELEKGDLSSDEIRELRSMAWEPYEAALFQRFNTFTLDAHDALSIHGDYRGAILNCAIASECLLDDLLCYALWWEGMTPQEATSILIKPIYKKVKSEFAKRFGGAWLPARFGPVLDWHTHVARRRDRIIHGGYQPTREEAKKALAVLSQLRAFIGKQVVSDKVRRDYIYLPLLLLGRQGLIATGEDPAALLSWYTDPVDFGARLDRWRAVCTRLKIESYADEVQPDLDAAVIYALVTAESITHYAVDAQMAVAAHVRLSRVAQHQLGFLKESQLALKGNSAYEVVPIVEMGAKDRKLLAPWQPVEEVLPGWEVSRPPISFK